MTLDLSLVWPRQVHAFLYFLGHFYDYKDQGINSKCKPYMIRRVWHHISLVTSSSDQGILYSIPNMTGTQYNNRFISQQLRLWAQTLYALSWSFAACLSRSWMSWLFFNLLCLVKPWKSPLTRAPLRSIWLHLKRDISPNTLINVWIFLRLA